MVRPVVSRPSPRAPAGSGLARRFAAGISPGGGRPLRGFPAFAPTGLAPSSDSLFPPRPLRLPRRSAPRCPGPNGLASENVLRSPAGLTTALFQDTPYLVIIRLDRIYSRHIRSPPLKAPDELGPRSPTRAPLRARSRTRSSGVSGRNPGPRGSGTANIPFKSDSPHCSGSLYQILASFQARCVITGPSEC